jgi:hypothetical protein
MRARGSIVSLWFAALLMAAPAARAYVVLKHWSSGETTKWPTVPIQWSMSTKVLTEIPAADIEAALQAAFDAWEAIGCSTVAFSYQGQKSTDPGAGIHVTFKNTNWDATVGDAAAYSQSEADSDGVIYSNDLVFNGVDVEWSTEKNTPNGKEDVQGVAAHEIGHSIGLDHPRYIASTMFFSGGSEELRTLEADDQAGGCFLYPAVAFTSGKACDACDKQSNCANGYCLNWGGGHAYCGQHCNFSSQCPEGYTCAQLTGYTQCLPVNEFCHSYGSNLEYGEDCYGHQTCASGLCLVIGGEAYCSKECTSDPECPNAMVCENGYCFGTGNLSFGEVCEVHTDCATAYCVEFQKDKKCTLPCGKNGGTCPSGSQCLQDLVCVPPGPRPNGATCYSPDQCVGTYCEDLKCTQPCSWGCPPDTTCVDGFCAGPAAGGNCANGAECPGELFCMIPTGKAAGSCEWACNPTTETGCPETRLCQWWWDTKFEKVSGTCRIPNDGAKLGESCEDKLCEVDLVCTLGYGTTKTCHHDCKLKANNLGCQIGQDCIDLGISGDPLRGACGWPDQPEPDPQPPEPDPAADTDTDGSPDAGSGTDSAVSPPDARSPPEATATGDTAAPPTEATTLAPAPEPGPGGGCSPGQPRSWWWLALLGIACGGLSRTTRPRRRGGDPPTR